MLLAMLLLIVGFLFISFVLSHNSEWGLLIAAFGPIAYLASGGIGGPYHLSEDVMVAITLVLWGIMCLALWIVFDRDNESTLFGIPAQFWGFGLILGGVVVAYFALPVSA